MGKISDYANVLKSKLTDLLVVYQRNDGELETKNATLEQLGDAICGEQVHATLETDDQTIIGGINELAKDKNVADEYDDTQTYDKGDVVIYKNALYICTTNNTTGAWDATKWTATTVQSLIGSLSSLTTTDKSSLVGAVNEVNSVTDISSNVSKTSIVNDFEKSVIKNNKLVSFYVGFSVNTAPSGVGGIATGFPIPKTLKQIPLICVSGTNKGKVARCAIDLNGNLINYYSDTSIWNVGDVYIVNACYLTA